MDRWIKRLIAVCEIGSGFMGLYFSLSAQPWKAETAPLCVFSAIAVLVFLLGIVAGLTLLETNQVGMALSAVYQAIQIPVLSSAVLSYQFVAPLQLGLALYKGNVGLLTAHGARFSLYAMTDGDLSIATGINLWALALFVYLCRRLWQTRGNPA